MSVSLNSPDNLRVPPFDQSIVEFVSPFVSSAYRRMKSNTYPTPSTTLTGDISRLANKVGEFSLETDQRLLLKNGVTFKQLEQRRRAVKYLEKTPKPKRHHIRNDGTLVQSKRAREETEELDKDFLRGTLKPKKLFHDKEQDVLDTTGQIQTFSSAIYVGNIVDNKNDTVLDVTLDESLSSLHVSSEVDKLHDHLVSSESTLADVINLGS